MKGRAARARPWERGVCARNLGSRRRPRRGPALLTELAHTALGPAAAGAGGFPSPRQALEDSWEAGKEAAWLLASPRDPPHRAAPLVFCTCSHVRRELPESADGATGPAPLPLRSCQSHPAKGWACDPGLDNWRAPSSGHSDWFKVAQTWPSSFL